MSVAINKLNSYYSEFSPSKTNTPLVVHPYAVLSLPVATQGFEPIAGRNAKIVEAFGGFGSIHKLELPKDGLVQRGRNAPHSTLLWGCPKGLKFLVFEVHELPPFLEQYYCFSEVSMPLY